MLELKEGYKGATTPEELQAMKDADEVQKMIENIDKNISDAQTVTTNTISFSLEDTEKNLKYYYPVFEDDIDVPCGGSPSYLLIRSTPTIKVRYHKELCPELIEMEKTSKGDFIDLRAAENVVLKQGEFKLISLGISIQLPSGYHAEVVPRSSTYKNFGIIMSNSIGIIDESYCGDNDIWMMPVIAMRDTEIHINDRICQFRIVKNRDIEIEVVDKLENEDRGGIGSTGKN